MPKSKRSRQYHLTNVTKKTREQKQQLFTKIQACALEYQRCFVLDVDGMRNTYLKEVRQELSDSRLFFGKTKLMARALGLTPETATAPGLSSLAAPYLTGAVGLLFTNRAAKDVIAYFAGFTPQDFARAGQTANAEFVVPRGTVYATGGRVPPENDVPMPAVLEPELRRLGMPVRLVRGKIVLEGAEEGAGDGSEDGGYRICKEGEVLDSRQTRLLKLFDACMSEFRVRVVAYWSADTEKVTEVEGLRARNKAAGDEMEVEGNDEDDDDQ